METATKPELQARMQAALNLDDADFSRYETDLYVVDKPGVRAWLDANYEFASNVQTFQGQAGSNWNGAGRECLDIPFACHRAT